MPECTSGIPQQIYSVWLQGLEKAPDLVRLNLDRWKALNPGWRLEVLTQDDVETLLRDAGFPMERLSQQAISDIVRVRLLMDRGGIWADASVFPIKPLCTWLPDAVTASRFFAFHRPGPDRLISSWFLASSPDNLLVRIWWEEIARFWSKPRRLMPGIPDAPIESVSPGVSAKSDQYPYFWLHYLFAYVVETQSTAKTLWNSCRYYSADFPHRLQLLFQANPHPTRAEIEDAAAAAPVQKLNWRASYPLPELMSIR